MRGTWLVLALLVLAGCTAPLSPDEAAVEARADDPTEPCGRMLPAFIADTSYNPTLVLSTSRGNITIETFLRQQPTVVGDILGYAATGFYDGQRFYSVVPDVALAFGDPQTTDPAERDKWGRTQPGQFPPLLVDHHRFLRHDEPGVVSVIAGSGPGATPPYLRIALQAAPDLEDQDPVFGRVVGDESWATLAALEEVPTDDQGRPMSGALINHATVLPAENDPEELTTSASLAAVDCEQRSPPGRNASFLLFAGNEGQAIDTYTFDVSAPTGWATSIAERVVPSGQTRGTVLNVTVPADAEDGARTLIVTATPVSGGETTSLELTLVVDGDAPTMVPEGRLLFDLTALTTDGRVMETTEAIMASGDVLPLFRPLNTPEDAFLPIPTSTTGPDGQELTVFPGAQTGLVDAAINEGHVVRVEAAGAWGDTWAQDIRGGRDAWFVVTPRADLPEELPEVPGAT